LGKKQDSDASARAIWDEIVDSLATIMKAAPPAIAIPAAQKYQHVFNALEVSKLAEDKRSGASDRETRAKASAGGTRSKKAASKASKRADAVNENPALADDVEQGKLGEEIKNAPPDDAGKITNRWLERRDDDAAKSRYERQRERRGATFGIDRMSGCEQMTMRGDRESINEVRSFLERRASELYRADGGRDVAPDDHPRTKTQRLFDAAVSLLTSSSGRGARRAPSPRAMLHVRLTVDAETGEPIEAEAPDGNGLLPYSVVQRYACLAELAVTVFNQTGKVLWHGRSKRFATDDQWVALVARDGGCVRCSAGPSMCIAHHLVPFGSPKKGETNVDEMAVVCDDCHHQIHDSGLTLYWQLGPPKPDGSPTWIWKARPATPEETPADHRPDQDNQTRAA